MNKRNLKQLYYDNFRVFNDAIHALSGAAAGLEMILQSEEELRDVFNKSEIALLLNTQQRIDRMDRKIQEVVDEMEAEGINTNREPWEE